MNLKPLIFNDVLMFHISCLYALTTSSKVCMLNANQFLLHILEKSRMFNSFLSLENLASSNCFVNMSANGSSMPVVDISYDYWRFPQK
jgi:hypothetical protein